MKNEKLFELIGSIDEEFIKEAGEEAMKDNGKKKEGFLQNGQQVWQLQLLYL